MAKHNHKGKGHFLGAFHIPEEAALCVARWKRDDVSADLSALEDAAPHPMTAAEAVATEGLSLVRANSSSGF